MKVVLSPRSEKELRKLSKLDQLALARKIRSLKEEEDSSGEEKLQGFRKIFRVRPGNFRIIYRKQPQEIYIILIGHRREVYEVLQRLQGY
ncbi:MAG: type II toxin-antitoxin system RelE/ParE family toxin [Patescibacteria group bacterium]